MLVSNPSPLSMRKVYPWITLDKIKHTLGWSDKDLADSLELTETRYRSLQQKGVIPSVHSIGSLSKRVGLSFDAIMLGQIDYKILKDRANGHLMSLPERFEVGAASAFSKRRTSINLLLFIENVYGWEVKKSILDHFQITDAAFQNPEENISFQFPTDLSEFMVRRGYPKSIFKRMGAYSSIVNRNTPLGQKISSFSTAIALHEGMFGDVIGKFYEKNCVYKIIKLDERECWVEATPSEELKEALKTNLPGNPHVCMIRGGSFASMTQYLGSSLSEVHESECIHRGDSRCLYKIQYPVDAPILVEA